MSQEMVQLYVELDQDETRFTIPLKTIFFCGGEIRPEGENGRPKSLRDYLIRIKKVKLPARIVRAESAAQLYRDTSYHDLISFEEDLARLASVVLVISESPGSFAELGAFSVNRTIRESLAIISQTKYETSESFIRFGPIQNIERSFDDSVAFYPWEVTTSNSGIVSGTARPHFLPIKQFIRARVDAAETVFSLNGDVEARAFYVIYWVLYLSYASSLSRLHNLVASLIPGISLGTLRDKLFCLKMMGWIDSQKYSNKLYFFALGDSDPFKYRYNEVAAREAIQDRRTTIAAQIRAEEKLPRHISQLVSARRNGVA